MTTAAYKDGVLVSDSGMGSHSTYEGSVRKLFRSKSNGIVAGCGDAVSLALIEEWAEQHNCDLDFLADIPERFDYSGLWIREDRSLWFFEKGVAFRFDAPFAAIGSGRDIALGAMAAGASAEQAVTIAVTFDNATHLPIQIMPVFTDNTIAFKKP